MADYDIPAAVDFIYNKIQKKVHLLGYSQGSAVIMASLAQKNQVKAPT